MSRSAIEWTTVVLTGTGGLTTIAAILSFRSTLPLARTVARPLGFLILYSGLALAVWSAWYLKRAIAGRVSPMLEHLVVAGPFRAVRHPVYLGMSRAMIGASVVARSVAGLPLTLLLVLPIEIHRARLEERALKETFGAEWKTYADQ
jgi:protein-S-isoprenylcysteine O-methyltransferase Ste14